MTHSLTAVCLSFATVGLVLAAPEPAVLHLAPDGNNQWSGALERPNADRTDGPLASLTGARNAIRKLRAAGAAQGGVRVLVADGEYTQHEPLVLSPEDSGTENAPVSFEAAPGAHPVFSGGRRIGRFGPFGDGLWAAHVPQVAGGDWYFEQLWVNGRRAVRARTPNVARLGETCVPRYLYTARKVGYGVDPLTGQVADLSRRAFVARRGDLAPLSGLDPQQLADVHLVAYHSWESSRHHVASIDPEKDIIITTGPAPWPMMMWGPNQRYHLEGFRAALDEPGEWFLHRDGTLLYMPLPGEDMAAAEVVAPVAESFIQIEGAPEARRFVEHVTFRGLDFRYSAWTLPERGHGDAQAAVSVPAVVMADGARDVHFEDCRIGHTAIYGLWFRRGCRDCSAVRCEVHDLGAGGLRIGEPEMRANENEQTGHIRFDNNMIHGGGRIFTGAIGVWVGQSSDNEVTHNDVSDFFYTGVSVGWSWGYRETLSKRNRIEFNHIHHIGWGVQSDMGAVYTLGLSQGTSISNNVIHDVYSYGKYGWAGLGLYNDEGSTGITLENNLVYRTTDMPYHQHYGRENVVRNNILALGRDYQVSVARAEEHLSWTFTNNIVYWESGKLFWGNILGAKVECDSNLYWKAAGDPPDFAGLSFPEWQALGRDQHSIIADPLFVDPDAGDFHLKPASPALEIGFKPFDYARAGVYGDAAWVQKAAELRYAPIEYAPDPPPPSPLRVEDGFEDYPVGAAPLVDEVHVENKGDAITVTDETAAAGGKSLKFTDAPALQYSFDPHMVYRPNYDSGTAVCRFDVRLEAGAELWHEFRDWSENPYKIGPSLQFADGKLSARGRELMDIPTGEWFRVETRVPLGDAATGNWTLTVTLPGEEPRVFSDLAVATPGWGKVTWLGFVSNANQTAVLYMDNLEIREE